MRAETACATPGCGEIVRSGKCPSCAARDRKRYRRRNAGQYGGRWQRRRRDYLVSHKTCECDECRILPAADRPAATDVHHVHGVVDGTDEADEQLRAYAHGHHSRETARLQPGGFNIYAVRDRVRAGRPVERPAPPRG